MALSERISLQEYCIKNHMEYLLEEWDKKKNGNLTPENITAGNQRKVWWIKDGEVFFYAGEYCYKTGVKQK